MKERPILFSTPMVQAILGGRKTMTRRIIKCRNHNLIHLSSNQEFRNSSPYPLAEDKSEKYFYFLTGETIIGVPCPYGIPGDRLWVRETWAEVLDFGYSSGQYFYRASYINGGGYDDVKKWKPSIFMPRSASRITLEITNVRVESLQEITEKDVMAEGIHNPGDPDFDYIGEFSRLWDSINGKKYPWSSNPWVFVIEFRRAG